MKSTNVIRERKSERYRIKTITSTTNPQGRGLAIQDEHSKPHDGTVDAKPSLRRRKVGEIFR